MNTKAWITPGENSIAEWWKETRGNVFDVVCLAAQWGADQELKECCEWLKAEGYESDTIIDFRAARRPRPPSLKEQALGALDRFNTNAHTQANEMIQDFDLIRQALENLDA